MDNVHICDICTEITCSYLTIRANCILRVAKEMALSKLAMISLSHGHQWLLAGVRLPRCNLVDVFHETSFLVARRISLYRDASCCFVPPCCHV
jgi:hypothetical protein